MPIGNSCIHSQANACITAATTRELAQISDFYTENCIESVACIAALPPASENTGRFIYVTDCGTYRYSDGASWTNDYTTTSSPYSVLYNWGRYTNPLGQYVIAASSPTKEASAMASLLGYF